MFIVDLLAPSNMGA